MSTNTTRGGGGGGGGAGWTGTSTEIVIVEHLEGESPTRSSARCCFDDHAVGTIVPPGNPRGRA